MIATGGGTTLLKSAGHRIVPFSPVLCPLKTDTAPIRGLSGLRAKCAVTLLRGEKTLHSLHGELLFRDYGVSGIVIFDLSRYAEPGDVLSVDLLPDFTYAELCKLFTDRRNVFNRNIPQPHSRSPVTGGRRNQSDQTCANGQEV